MSNTRRFLVLLSRGAARGVGRAAALVISAGLITAPAAALAATQESPAAADGAASEISLPSGFEYPNGIARAANGALYVGSVVDGRILVRPAGGSWRTFFPGSAEIYAGTSLRLDQARSVLWGASPDFLAEGRPVRPHRVFAIDLGSGAVRRAVTIPDGGFGNDLAVEPDGSVLVTDSRNGRVLRLPAGADRFEIVVADARLRGPNGIGVGGIARAPDGRLALGNFGSGKLYALEGAGLREIVLPRLIENPDGLAFADGALLVTEGAVTSGDGKVLRVDDPFGPGVRVIETLTAGLESPVNLTVSPDGGAWITEARIRHRMISDQNLKPPTRFRLVVLPAGTSP